MLHEKLMKMGEGKPKLSPLKLKAKQSVLEDLSSQASSKLADKLKGLKKVSVASNSPEGLEEGLEKAQELVESKPFEGEESTEEEAMEHAEMENAMDGDSEEESEDDELKMLNDKVAMLEAKLDQLLAKG